MDHKELSEDITDSKEVLELIRSINERIRRGKNAKEFINYHKLIEYKGKDLPYKWIWGTFYLIKNNSIMQITSGPAQVNVSRSIPWFKEIWTCTVTVHNLHLVDVGEFENTSMFVDMDELVSTNMDRSENFLMTLIRAGFNMYTNKNY